MDFKQSNDNIILGSGEIYIGLYEDIEDVFDLTEEEEKGLLNVGAVESGATLTVENNFEGIESDNRGTIAQFNQGKDVIFSTGVMNWDTDMIAKFLTGSNIIKEGNKTIMRISDKDVAKDVYIRFIHEKKDGSGFLIVNVFRANFTGNLEFVFSKEGATTTNYEFTANSVGEDSDYLEIVEEEIEG